MKDNTNGKQTLSNERCPFETSLPLPILQKSKLGHHFSRVQNSHISMDLIELIRGRKS